MQDFVIISEQVIDITKLISKVRSPLAGAISIFIGCTRNHFEGNIVTSLVYEAYLDMAQQELYKLTTKARQNWKDIICIAIQHRIGKVDVLQDSVAILVSSPHRETSQQASSFLIEELKRTVPIWKKEMYADGSSNWKSNKCCIKSYFLAAFSSASSLMHAL